uniref:von Willebrand factor A domain-containing protein 1 n=1 Tax=Pyxicephalus adspersus TaxID=30357 RepID=A0AAV2ZGV2_PYXAD|nr:TPA: hypothetical protein GDO54_003699 [Pyxicephalus adspersus]
MFVYLGFYLHILLSSALGHTIPEADHTSFVPDSEGDLLFLLDSSGSVTYDEFANVKEFIGDLLRPFKFGPQDVQASVMQISTNPTLEFPLNQYTSSQDIQKAIQSIRQRMGDTNTGKALDYVKKQLYAEKFGSRNDVPKVMVWVTDGLSTDDISEPMQLLKDMGVTVFIVCTTGRGNFEELSSAASQPDEKHLKFVDKDDLGIITKELRDSIIELIQAKRLHALDITSTSFRLMWPRLLSKVTGHYVLEYAPVAYPRQKTQEDLPGDQTSFVLTGLTPSTTYQVTLYPESNVNYVGPQSIQVSTLPGKYKTILISDPTAHSFRVSWGPHMDSVIGYEIQYGPLPSNSVQTVHVDSRFNSTVIEGLKSNTTYLVTVSAIFKSGGEKSLSAIACTEIKGTKVKYLRIEDLQSNSLKAVWGSADGDVQGYQIRCRRQAGRSMISVAPETHSVQLTGLPEGSTTKICVKPVYRNGAGKNLCKKVQMHSGNE